MRLKSTRVSFAIAAKLVRLLFAGHLGPWSMRSMRSRRSWINHRPETGSTVRKRPKAQRLSTLGELSAWTAAMKRAIDRDQSRRYRSADMVDTLSLCEWEESFLSTPATITVSTIDARMKQSRLSPFSAVFHVAALFFLQSNPKGLCSCRLSLAGNLSNLSSIANFPRRHC